MNIHWCIRIRLQRTALRAAVELERLGIITRERILTSKRKTLGRSLGDHAFERPVRRLPAYFALTYRPGAGSIGR